MLEPSNTWPDLDLRDVRPPPRYGKEEVSFLTPARGVYGIIVTTKAGSSNYALTIN